MQEQLRTDPESMLRSEWESLVRDAGANNRAPCSWGFKVFPDHAEGKILDGLLSIADAAIVLERGNVSAQLLSNKHAKAVNCVGSADTCDPVAVSPSALQELEAFETKSRHWYARVRGGLGQQRMLDITTESFLRQPRASWRSLFGSVILQSAHSSVKAAITSTGAPVVDEPRSTWSLREEHWSTCDLCEHEWLFVLSTGRAGSSSILDALNTLPGVQVSARYAPTFEPIVKLPAHGC